jgi:hypothetical protein
MVPGATGPGVVSTGLSTCLCSIGSDFVEPDQHAVSVAPAKIAARPSRVALVTARAAVGAGELAPQNGQEDSLTPT